MNDPSKAADPPRRPAKSSDSEKARLERQSAALRENLRRRNAQRRGREADERDSEPETSGLLGK